MWSDWIEWKLGLQQKMNRLDIIHLIICNKQLKNYNHIGLGQIEELDSFSKWNLHQIYPLFISKGLNHLIYKNDCVEKQEKPDNHFWHLLTSKENIPRNSDTPFNSN